MYNYGYMPVLDYTWAIICGISNIIAIVVCAVLADKKGRSVGGWIAGGFFLGWIGVIILCFLSDRTARSVVRPTLRPSYSTTRYPCVNCREMISTVQCPYCGYNNSARAFQAPRITGSSTNRQSIPVCPNCGSTIKAGSSTCEMCGHKTK